MLGFGKKVAAARTMLDWKQAELAERASVDTNTINKIENGHKPNDRTADKILRALSSAGVLLTSDGVSMPDTSSTIFDGPAWFTDFLEDVYLTLLKDDRKELLILNGDNRKSPPEVVAGFRRIRQSGVRIREMVEEGNTYLHGPEIDYRWIPSQHFSNFNTIIYGDKVLTDFQSQGVLFTNKHRAETDRRNFNLIWSLLPELTVKSTADVRY